MDHWMTLSEYEEGTEVIILCKLPQGGTVQVRGLLIIDPNTEFGIGSDVALPGMPIGWRAIE